MKIKIWSIIILLSIIPNILYWYQEDTNAFLYPRITISKISYDNNVILTRGMENEYQISSNAITLVNTPALTSFLVIFRTITNIDFKIIQFLPISGIILIFMSFAFAKKFLGSLFLIIIFVLYISYEPVIHGLSFSVFSHGIAMILYFTFILLYFYIIDNRNRFISISLILVVFLTTLLTYYSFEVYMIIFSFSMFIFFKLNSCENNEIKKYSCELSLVFLIMFFTFDKIFYDTFNKMNNNIYDSILSYFHTIIPILNQDINEPIRSEYQSSIINNYMDFLLNNIGMLFYLVIAVPVLILMVYELYHFSKYRQCYTKFANLQFALIITAMSDLIIYLGVGFISFKYVLYIIPILTLLAVEKLTKSRIKFFFLFLFIVLLLSKFVLWNLVYIQNQEIDKYSNIGPISKWLSIKSNDRFIVTDVITSGKVSVESAYLNKTVTTILFSSEILKKLIEDGKTIYLDHYFLIIDYKNIDRSITGSDWKSFASLIKYLDKINNNKNLNIVYNDGLYIVYDHGKNILK